VAPGTAFTLWSSAVTNGGRLPPEFTGDGKGTTLPLKWNSPPVGTKAYAVIMHHIDPEGITKWYWTLYNIPADVRSLPANVRGIGILGNNSINGRTEYAPPHSKGPGDKIYILTVYALSSPVEVTIPADQVTRDVLLASMKNRILASSELRVVYAREGASTDQGSGKGSGAFARDVPPNNAERGGLGNRGGTN
jgi:phosphatidylethanolamine-binding protein (PEBP) family uncharacterized protein